MTRSEDLVFQERLSCSPDLLFKILLISLFEIRRE